MTLPAEASRVICESDMTKGLEAVVGANPWEAPVPDAETLLIYLVRVSDLSQSWQSWTRSGLRTYLKDRREPRLFRLIGIPLSEIRSRLAECAVEVGGNAVA